MWSHAGFYQSCIDTYTCKGLCAPCGCLALYTGYIFGSLLATPFILIGGTIKLCILGCDEPAAAHNRQEEKTYIEKPVMDKINRYQNKINKNNEEIEIIETYLEEYKIKLSDQITKNQLYNQTTINAPPEIYDEMSKLLITHQQKCSKNILSIEKNIISCNEKILILQQKNNTMSHDISNLEHFLL
jgi:hypothetical protein